MNQIVKSKRWEAPAAIVTMSIILTLFFVMTTNSNSPYINSRHKASNVQNAGKALWSEILNEKASNLNSSIDEILQIIARLKPELLLCPITNEPFHVNTDAALWLDAADHSNEMAVVAPMSFEIGNRSLYPAICFDGTVHLLELQPQWVSAKSH